MILKIALAGLVAIGSALGAGYYAIGAASKNDSKAAAGTDHFGGIDYVKIPSFAVPVIQDGVLEGYIVSEWVFTIDAKTKAALSVPPEIFIREDAFRSLYGEVVVDFDNLDRVDLVKLAEAIRLNVNKRIETDAITSVLVQKFDYVESKDIRDNSARSPGG